MKKTKLTILLAAGALAAAACTATPAAAGTIGTSSLHCVTGQLDSAAKVQGLIDNFHDRSWGGSDGGASVGLSDGRTLMMFGDTFQDPNGVNANGSRRPGYQFKHNSGMFIGGSCLESLNGPNYSELLPNNSDGSYYWPGQPGLMRRPGLPDRLWIPAARVKTTSGATFGFTLTGMDMFAFDIAPGGKPTLVAKYPMPNPYDGRGGQPGVAYNAGSIVSGGYLYLYGSRKDPATYFASNIYVARVPLGSVGSPATYRYWDGLSWGTSPSRAATIQTHDAHGSGPSGGWPVALINGKYVVYSKPDGFAGAGVVVWTSPTLTGPWLRGPQVYSAPSTNDRNYQYGGAEHPLRRLADGNLLVCNSRNSFRGPDLTDNQLVYKPQFHEVPQP